MLTLLATIGGTIIGVVGAVLGPIFTKIETSVIGLFSTPELVRTGIVGAVITVATGVILSPQLTTLHWLVCTVLIGGIATIAVGVCQMFTGTAPAAK